MFTGLIESVCTVKAAGGGRLTVDLGRLAEGTATGDSIAVNGVCLTVTRLAGTIADFDLSPETIAKSAVGRLKPSCRVNAERAMDASGRFGGHFVQGHIDGTAVIKSINKHGAVAEFRFAASGDILENMVVKGSVAVDGISLTVAGMDAESFSVAVIPQTLGNTTLAGAKTGDIVNIETDIIVKTVKKQLEKILPKQGKLTAERFIDLGF